MGVFIIFLVYLGLKRSDKVPLPRKLQKVTVLLDWFPNTNHTGIYVAKEKGYFASNGLDVSILQPAESGNNQVIATGKADFGVSYQEDVTLARAAGIPIVSLAAVIQHNSSAFASLKESNITTVKDFEGKRYGGWGSPIEEAVIKSVMTEAGADYSKVKNITIGETDFFKTIGRDSDFQWIFYYWDGIEARLNGIKLNMIMLRDLNPALDYYTPVIVTNENNIKNKKDLVIRFMKAVKQGYEFSIKNPHDAATYLIRSVPELNQELVRESQLNLSSQYQSDAKSWGLQKESVWKNYAQWLVDHKLMKKMIDIKGAFTNEFIK